MNDPNRYLLYFIYNSLLYAVKYNDVNMAKKLLHKYHYDINSSDKESKTLLHYAAKNGNTAMVKVLLSNGGNPNIRTHVETSPLHFAVESGRIKLVKALLDHGAVINNFCNKTYCTPLFIAVERRNAPMVRLLMENGANADIINANSVLPLHYAIRFNLISICTILLNYNTDVNLKDWYSYTSLHYAVLGNNLKCVLILLKAGADTNIRNNNGKTPLIYAIENQNVAIVKLLLYNSSDINAIDPEGYTPFTWCVESYNNPKLNKLMISRLMILKYKSTLYDSIGFNRNIELVNNDADFKNYAMRCEEELQIMKNYRLGHNKISLFDCCLDTTNNIAMKYTKAMSKIHTKIQFPIYAYLITEKLKLGIEKLRYTTMSLKTLDDLAWFSTWNRLPTEIKYLLLEYLSIRELKFFVRLVKR